MSVTSVEKDPESLTMTVTADLDATVERVWQLWADPRQFERWWGPPGYPATVVDHDMNAGGRITFFMIGDEGERFDSTWEVIAADPPRHLELRDADVDDNGRPNDGNSMTGFVITIDEKEGGGAVMAIHSRFDSLTGMEEVLGTGFQEGMCMVFSQIEALLADTLA
ncbi:MAG TPA: SRPBCC domain-containing protein [Acidimicrobiales bacterium]